MSKSPVSLEFGKYYHIYNRGVDGVSLFKEDSDSEYFLRLYDLYINPIGETFAWCLMGNHFHFLLRIKEDISYKYIKDDFDRHVFLSLKWETIDVKDQPEVEKNSRIPNPIKHFSHLCNAYSKYFNNKYDRTGSLFKRSFNRREVKDKKYLQKLILYIHNNPVSHGFCKKHSDYRWTSYHSIISDKESKIMRKEVLEYFDDVANFKFMHKYFIELDEDM